MGEKPTYQIRLGAKAYPTTVRTNNPNVLVILTFCEATICSAVAIGVTCNSKHFALGVGGDTFSGK